MYLMSREIGIDAGHRVPTHGSKCKNLHGHRYTIQAWCKSSSLHQEGEQYDMVLDFGFLKEEMMQQIDHYCDHALILWAQDPLLGTFITTDEGKDKIADWVLRDGWCTVADSWTLNGVNKLYIIPDIPTAEVLAKHWFYRLKERVSDRSARMAELVAIKVWETPNCFAVYSESDDVLTQGR